MTGSNWTSFTAVTLELNFLLRTFLSLCRESVRRTSRLNTKTFFSLYTLDFEYTPTFSLYAMALQHEP
jgi:hypothetical protein